MQYVSYFLLTIIGASAMKIIIDLIFHQPEWSASWVFIIILSLVLTLIEFFQTRKLKKIGKSSGDDF